MDKKIEQLNELEEKISNDKRISSTIDKKTNNFSEMLIAVFDSVKDGICILDTKGKIIYVNKEIIRISGYSEKEFVGNSLKLLKMFAPKDMVKILGAFVARMAGKEILPYDIDAKTKDGKKITVEIYGAVIKINDKIVGDAAIIRDITERKKSEEVIKNSEDRLKTIFDFAPAAYYVYDQQGNFIDGNKAAEKMIGYNKEELIGKSFLKLNLLQLNEIPKAAKLVAENFLGKKTSPTEFTLRRKDGSEIIIEISAAPIKIKSQNLILGMARDITEIKKTMQELKDKNEELEKFQQLSVGRELKIIELKNKIKELEDKIIR